MICGGLWRRQSARSTTVVGEIEDWASPFQSQFQHWKWKNNNCVRQEEPAILIFRLLLRMRRMYVASIPLEFH